MVSKIPKSCVILKGKEIFSNILKHFLTIFSLQTRRGWGCLISKTSKLLQLPFCEKKMNLWIERKVNQQLSKLLDMGRWAE